MKTWMKVLTWLGLGGGIGFFAGYQVGTERGNKRLENIQMSEWAAYEGGYNQALRDEHIVKHDETWEDARRAFEEYRAQNGLLQDEGETVEPDEPEMPEEIPVIGDEAEIEDIPELHPQHMIPERITEEEYYANPWGYDQEQLMYYEGDRVLFNKDTRSAITSKDDMDQVIGIGMIFSFYQKDGEVLDAIFVRNDTMGVIFRIDRLEDCYDPENNTEYENEEEDDTEEDLD